MYLFIIYAICRKNEYDCGKKAEVKMATLAVLTCHSLEWLRSSVARRRCPRHRRFLKRNPRRYIGRL